MWKREWQGAEAVVLWAALATAAAIIGCGESRKKEQGIEVAELAPRNASVEPAGGGSMSKTEVTGPVSYVDAETAYKNGQFDEAVTLFKGYTAGKPENPWGHFMLGLSAWKVRDLDQAEAEFLRAIELDPKHVKSRYNLVRVYLDKGEAEKAVDHIDAAIKLDSSTSEGYRLLGRIKDDLKALPEAEEAYRQALKINGGDVWAMNNLGLNLVKQGKFERAIVVFARVTELKPDNPTFQNNLGMALELNGYFTGATKAYQAAVSVDGSYQKAVSNLARVEILEDKPGLPVLDLEALAKTFATRQ